MRPEIVLFGDSLTEQSFSAGGWGAALADTYSRKADVLVRGYDGYNTRWALILLPHVFSSKRAPAVVTVFFGANDATILGGRLGRLHVPVEEYKDNLKTIVNHLKECYPTSLVVLITPPPVDEEGPKEYARSLADEEALEFPERRNEVTGLYATKCLELANEMGLHAIDLWSKLQETEGWQNKFLSDGVHLTPEGNAIVHQELQKVLNETPVSAAKLPLDFPHHSKIDGKCPEKAFQYLSLLSSHYLI
ncbi:GDSL esterase/lipase At5g62930-like [Cucurbita moschata]|uniref:GDSL esterase/lipase At5g62930-like n=1 Tax=Cucurbita moschata TaxID=3662 RepID=A0A6J1FLG5_CUCMO|nr:GDSL esterase/lipase At5g62930-like [Cucurbita moschata]